MCVCVCVCVGGGGNQVELPFPSHGGRWSSDPGRHVPDMHVVKGALTRPGLVIYSMVVHD